MKPNTILRRSNNIELRLDSMHSVEIIVNTKAGRISKHALAILDVFSNPVSMRDAVEKLGVHGVQDWVEVTGTIDKLYKIGALIDHSKNQNMSDKRPDSFGSAPIHIDILNDKRRTREFIDAISKVVKKDDVVIDIGTGTGVLAIAAARAGAKKVYAIEAGAMAGVAQDVVNRAGLADKITIVRGWSTQIELPEMADLLISEIIGNDPFQENVLPVMKDARRRLLKPGARLVPQRIKVFALPVVIPGPLLRNRIVKKEYLADWKSWYDIDFSALRQVNTFQSIPILKLKTEKAKKLEIAGEPLLLTDTDFAAFDELKLETIATAKSTALFNGLLVYFELTLAEKVFSTHPQIADEDNSWSNPVWYFPEAENIKTGSSFSVKFSYQPSNNSQLELFL